MKKVQPTPENFNSAFLNVTLSAKTIDGKYAMWDLQQASKGNWVISEEAAPKVKYVYPVRKNKILGVFEVTGYEVLEIDGQNRVRFELKAIYENSTRMISTAESHLNKTNYVVKFFEA
jgi:hypothetical protein